MGGKEGWGKTEGEKVMHSSSLLCCHSSLATEAFDVLQISNFIIENPLLLPSPPLPHPPPPPSLSALALKQAFLPHSPKPPCTPPLSMLKLRNWKPCRRDSSYGLIIHWAVPVCAKCMSVCVCMYTRVWVSHVLAVGWNRDFVMPYLWLS